MPSYANPIPDYYPQTQNDWRWVYHIGRPIFDKSKTGERLNQAERDPNVVLALDGQPEEDE